MGVYIKGMKMPKNCWECPFRKFWDDEDQCLAKKNLWVKSNEIPPVCPLVELPSHGRLIDADAVERNLIKMQMAQKDVVGHGIRKSRAVVRDMATIIPADESNMDSFIHIFEEDDEEDGMDSFIRILKD